MKPIILITASLVEDERFLRLDRAYTESIVQAGGVPVVADFSEGYERALDMADGVLFSGGVDIAPIYFSEEPNKEIGESTPLRDVYELKLFAIAVKKKIPILGICRGAQLLNTALGGKLFQDIYSQVKNPINHSQKMSKKYASHSVRIFKNSILSNIANCEQIQVNSFHHQSVSILGDGLKITAEAPDGVIEAFEHTEHSFLMGVQWHPEQMAEPIHREIFRNFVSASGKYKGR